VFLFNCRDLFKLHRNIIITFFAGFGCELVIHRRPLVFLTLGCRLQILARARNLASMEQLIPHLRVLALIAGSFFKNRLDLFVAILLRLRCKEAVPHRCLRFASQRCFQIFPGFATLFECFCHFPP
jgi:hypothetical protein